MSFKTELRLLLFLFLIIVFVGGVWFFTKSPAKDATATTQTQQVVQEIPPYTPEIAAQLEKSKGFQMLISYTEQGFEPVKAELKKGDTVRFTNNSTHDLWIAADGDKKYPGKSECGESMLESCKKLVPGDFWEFTFEKSGTWTYRNTLGSSSGTVIVK